MTKASKKRYRQKSNMNQPKRRRMKERLINKYGAICQLCGRDIDLSLNQEESQWAFTMDHIIEVVNGGKTAFNNLQPAHHICNQLKSSLLTANVDNLKLIDARLVVLFMNAIVFPARGFYWISRVSTRRLDIHR